MFDFNFHTGRYDGFRDPAGFTKDNRRNQNSSSNIEDVQYEDLSDTPHQSSSAVIRLPKALMIFLKSGK